MKMTIKDLIKKLLDLGMSLDSEIMLTIKDPHETEHGEVSGYMFDIDDISQWGPLAEIVFTDWRDKKEVEKENDNKV